MQPATIRTAAPIAPIRWANCRLCTAVLDPNDDDLTRGLCQYCKSRPEARRLDGHLGPAPVPATKAAPRPGPAAASPTAGPRAFTPAERSLIKSMHGYLPAAKLLALLNERLEADLGSNAPPHTLEQLHAEVRDLVDPGDAPDWAGLRRVLAQARRSGLLAAIAATTIEDFAVVFQLTPAQLMHLRDVVHHAQEDRRC